MSTLSDFFSAGVVVLAAVGQLNTNLGQGCWCFVGVTSVRRAVMASSSENSKSPFRGLECLRPSKGVNVLCSGCYKSFIEELRPSVVHADTHRALSSKNPKARCRSIGVIWICLILFEQCIPLRLRSNLRRRALLGDR